MLMRSCKNVIEQLLHPRSFCLTVSPWHKTLSTYPPGPPSRRLTRWHIFVRENYSFVTRANPDFKNAEKLNLLGKMFRELDENQVQKYEQLLLLENNRLKKEMKAYERKVPAEIRAAHMLKTESRRKQLYANKVLQAVGKPCKPMNDFLLFHRDFRRKNILVKGISKEECQRNSSALWKSLPENEKKKWRMEAERLKEEQKLKFANWESEIALSKRLDTIEKISKMLTLKLLK